MERHSGDGAPEQIKFDVVARRAAEEPDQPLREASPRLPAVKRSLLKAVPGSLAVALVGGALVAVGHIPDPPDPLAPPAQHLQDASPDPEVEQPDVVDLAEVSVHRDRPTARKARRDTKRKRIVKTTFSIGGGALTGGTGTAGSTTSESGPTTTSTHSKGKPASKKKEKPAPKGPQAGLHLRRLHKPKTGDHFHSVNDADIATKQGSDYDVVESIGYLFEEKIPGTRLLAIDEGVMGWIYEDDQGAKTKPLYRLKGPDYHDYEVIFTSSETVKDEWIGNGWRLERVEGYLVAS